MNDPQLAPVRRALISVSDKSGIVEFARDLSNRGVALLSTGAPVACFVRRALK